MRHHIAGCGGTVRSHTETHRRAALRRRSWLPQAGVAITRSPDGSDLFVGGSVLRWRAVGVCVRDVAGRLLPGEPRTSDEYRYDGAYQAIASRAGMSGQLRYTSAVPGRLSGMVRW